MTEHGGRMMGMGGDLGLVKEGYLADLILFDGDPTRDIRILQDRDRIKAIVQEGAFHKRDVPQAAYAGQDA
jgi:imidazolonepropionase-like amidohydrolase